MHYRRLEVQPHEQGFGTSKPDWRGIDKHVMAFWDLAIGETRYATPPPDMPNAVPWQAKDGEWFWRMETIEVTAESVSHIVKAFRRRAA